MSPETINGLFAIAGVIVGSCAGIFGAVFSTKHAAWLKAGNDLRVAFAQEKAMIKIETEPFKVIDALKDAFPRHYAAIEVFSFYLCEEQEKEYRKAWEQYHHEDFYYYAFGENRGELFHDSLQKIFSFTRK